MIAAGYQGTPASVIKHMGYPMERLKKKYIEEGNIVDDGLTVYVDQDVTLEEGNDGTSWEKAYDDLQQALSQVDPALDLVEIWVAAHVVGCTTGGGHDPYLRVGVHVLHRVSDPRAVG